jgi:hypothetical protein
VPRWPASAGGRRGGLVPAEVVPSLPADHGKAIAAEGTEAAFAQIRREDVELRTLGEFKQAYTSVEELCIFTFQQSGARQLPVGLAQQSSNTARRGRERKSPQDAAAHIHADK